VLKPIIFGKYCLLERVSVGGMAEVFRARPFNAPNFKRFLAVKRILPNLAEDEEFISMFVDEAKIAVQLNHRQVCQIYELGKLNDSYYIVMEYIPGKNLLQVQNHLRKNKRIMSVTQAAYIAQRMCEGLDYSHRKVGDNGKPLNIIHRDISPQNVLVSYDGEVKVIDFGIARAASQNKQTQVGVLKGKFGYMSPEQVSGEEIDRRSDVFAVGTLLWEMLTARRLFYGENDFETLEKVRSEEIRPPSSRNQRVPEEMDRIVMRALDRNRETRYQWAGEFAEDLATFLSAIKPPFSDRILSKWMVTNWAEDLQLEKEKIELFRPFVTVEDVVRYNDTLYESLDDDLLEMDEEDLEDATRVFDPTAGGADEEVLAENEDEPMATVVMSVDEIELPDAPKSHPGGGTPTPTPDIFRVPEHDSQPFGSAAAATAFDFGTTHRRRTIWPWVMLGLVLTLALGAVAAYAMGWIGPKPAKMATLELVVTPDQDVLVRVGDQDYPWTVPMVISDLEPGAVLLEIRHTREEYETLVERVELEPGTRTRLERTLNPIAGDVTVTLRLEDASAQVYLNGQLIGGQGDVRSFSASARTRHVVEVFKADHFVETYAFELGNGHVFERDVSLRPVLGSISVRSEPAGTILLDGEELGDTRDRFVLDDLDPARVYELEVRSLRPGFRPFRQTIVFDTFYDLRLQPRLRRIGEAETGEIETPHGFITTGESSGWYRVLVDGRDTGFVTPISEERPLPLKTGARTITFARAGVERSVSVSIIDGQTMNVAIPSD